MRIIRKVALAELRNLFFSPVAWFVIICFYVVVAALFTTMTSLLVNLQDVEFQLRKAFGGFNMGMMEIIFLPISGQLLTLVYLFIPLLTMGIINREYTNNTVQLLYSSPVRTGDIILGKYLAMVIVNIVLLLALAIFITCGLFIIEGVEYRWLLSVLLGFFLLMNTYAAIGVFISSLTRYQLVAAVMMFAVFFIMENLSAIWQQYDLVRDITYYLSLSGKAETLLMGLITSRELLYFMLVIALFLGFTWIRLNSTQRTVGRLELACKYALLFVLFVTGVYFSSRRSAIAYKDVTNNQLNTIDPQLQQLLAGLDGSPLKVTLFTNLLGISANHGLPQQRNKYIWKCWEQYFRFYPNIELDYIYYYDVAVTDSSWYRRYPRKSLEEIAGIQADIYNIDPSLFMTPNQFRSMANLEGDDLKLLMQLEYKGKKALLRTRGGDPAWPDQSMVAGTLKRLVRDKEIRVSFVTGHYERAPFGFLERDYGQHLTFKADNQAAINRGFDTDTISLLHQDVPADVDVLVIADPLSPYQPEETARIRQYIARGGNALFYTEPEKKFILQPLLADLGITIEDGTIVYLTPHELPNNLPGRLTNAGLTMANEPESVKSLREKINLSHINFIGASQISYNSEKGFSFEPIATITGGANSWIKKGVLVADSAAPEFSGWNGDERLSEYVTVAALTRTIDNKEQRVIVASDADFMARLRYNMGTQGLAFYSWLLYNEYPVYVNERKAKDNKFRLRPAGASVLRYGLLYGIPGLLLIGAVVWLLRRNRK
ncbi:MAG: Gldg family protein [Candidatus Pseudobacter hemicellulosilyticus]|uniref:Gldg family protein n=1 Tax=Candidatus Pseudobacter hemicellulosilyticus TaxID=3121375 RepID=A0AAJ5WTW2_9BACT|nr:MAG: Gldg family protein [Pseudobacter sp.]